MHLKLSSRAAAAIVLLLVLPGAVFAAATAVPNPAAFGNVPLNTTATQSVTITVDAGYRTEVASGSGLNAPFAFNFDTCGTGGGFTGPGTCNVNETFTPTALGAASATTNVFECPIAGGTCIGIPFADTGTGVSAATAVPNPAAFGNVPLNTTATQSVTITVDAGYRTEVASGSGLNAPFAFNFDTCGTGGGFTGPGTCNVNETFTPTVLGAASATTNVFECPIAGGSCIGIPFADTGTGVSTLTITTPSLPDGTLGSPYPATTLAASGGTGADTWSLSSGSLPTGLTLDASTGVIDGTPSAAGTFTFTVSATDSGTPTPQTATKALSITVNAPAPTLTAISITPATPTVATGASLQFTATGTYSDASTADLTSVVTWASSSPAVATIGTTTGAALGVSPGTSTVSATLGPVSGSTLLTVYLPDTTPPAVTTPVLSTNPAVPGAAVNVTASATDGTAVASAELSLDGGVWTALSATDGAFGGTSEGLSGTFTAPASTGSHSVCVRATDSVGNTSDGSACATFLVVSKLNQAITFGGLANKTMAQSPVTVSATASSGLAVTFTTSTPSVCTAGGLNGATITLVGPGLCTVRANQPGNAVYNPAAMVSRRFLVVSRLNQAITFGGLANKTMAQSPVTVSATASSGLAVTFTTSTPSVCTAGGLNGATITLVGPGLCTVRANQPGNAVYNPAAMVSRSFLVVRRR